MNEQLIPENHQDVIAEFRDIIDERGIMHKWVADKLGIGKSRLSNIFNGRGNLTEENRKKLNELLNTSI